MGGTTLWASATAIVVTLLLVGSASAAGSQKWYPDSSGTVYDTAYRESEPGQYYKVVDDGGFQIWQADEVATADVNFGMGDWEYHLTLNEEFVGAFNVSVGSYDPDTDAYTWVGTATVSSTGSDLLYTGAIPVGDEAFVVPQGDYLVFRLNNTEDPATGDSTVDRMRAVNLETGTTNTYFASPASDPGYPAAELPAFAIAGVGLLALAARRVWRRR